MSFCFDSSRIIGFGISGQQTARQMAEAIDESFKDKCQLIYNESTQKFTILNSKEISAEAIQKVFSKHKYTGWKPEIERSTDSEGNKTAKLIEVRDQEIFLLPTLEATALTSSSTNESLERVLDKESVEGGAVDEINEIVDNLFSLLHKHVKSLAGPRYEVFEKPKEVIHIKKEIAEVRKETAEDLVLKMKSFNVVFKNKKCLDVGCRSGENALAMQNAGASVIAIDPDDNEFESAVKIGLSKEQLYKLTLQEYHKLNLKERFDIATVFLYCIPLLERESFVDTLANIIKKDGTVIIGYSLEDGILVYDKDPQLNLPKLMRKYFSNVTRVECPYTLNHYLLICKHNV